MNKDSTTAAVADGLFAGDAWFDPIEAGLRGGIRGFIEAMLEEELAAALGGGRYERGAAGAIVTANARVSCLARLGRRRSAYRGRG